MNRKRTFYYVCVKSRLSTMVSILRVIGSFFFFFLPGYFQRGSIKYIFSSFENLCFCFVWQGNVSGFLLIALHGAHHWLGVRQELSTSCLGSKINTFKRVTSTNIVWHKYCRSPRARAWEQKRKIPYNFFFFFFKNFFSTQELNNVSRNAVCQF